MGGVPIIMPSVNLRKEIFDELLAGSRDVSEKVNEIVQGYLSLRKKYESPNVGESAYRDYFIHGNGD